MGCVEGAGPSSGTADTAKAAPASFRSGSAREVEAPEVYQVTDNALWDGRPSLGGIWVAASDVVDPERVVILNPATGKTVTGALFRRERENPGPPLQVSSDAAEALGMLAGQPTSLRVTALRRATDPEPAADDTAVAAAESPEAPAGASDSAATGTAAETAALATAALAATDGTTEAATDAGAATSAAVDAAAEAGSEVAATEPPKRKTWKERRAEAKAKREAEKAAKAAAAAAAAAAEGTATGEPAATADEAAVAAVETAPLDARSPEVSATSEEKTPAAPAAVATAAPAASPPAEPAATPAGGPARSIQIASFSKEDNAKRAVEALAKVSVTAEVRRSDQGGKVVWGVVTSGDDAQLAAIKKAGFADAYFLD
jgi:hypothetical protein